MAVIANPCRSGLLLTAVIAFWVVSAPAYCGDEDRGPAYKIYIDPETGKYTTEDPHDAAVSPDTAAVPGRSADAEQSNSTLLITSVGVVAVLLAIGAVWRRHKINQVGTQ